MENVILLWEVPKLDIFFFVRIIPEQATGHVLLQLNLEEHFLFCRCVHSAGSVSRRDGKVKSQIHGKVWVEGT